MTPVAPPPFVFGNHAVHTVFIVLAALRIRYAAHALAAGAPPERAARDEAVFSISAVWFSRRA